MAGQPRERGPHVQRGPSRVTEEPREVVRAKQAGVAGVLDGARQVPPALPGETLLCLDHDRQLHPVSPSRRRICACLAAPVSYDQIVDLGPEGPCRSHVTSRSTPSTASKRVSSSCPASRRSSGFRWTSTAPTAGGASTRAR